MRKTKTKVILMGVFTLVLCGAIIPNATLFILNIDSTPDGFLFDFSRIQAASNDTDNDGLNDYNETNVYFTDPYDSDTDDDNLTDGEEILTYFSNATYFDTDYDSMPDGWEVDNSLNLLNSSDASVDSDSDGLTNLQEYTNGTDPWDSDTDDDDLTDGEEVETYYSNATYFDTDYDSMPDGWEVNNSLDLLNSSDASIDSDSDDLTNLQEYNADTDPWDSDCDNDGINDGGEVNGYGPYSYDSDPWDTDSDDDGLGDYAELTGNSGMGYTDPEDVDTDDDLYSDYLEFRAKCYGGASNSLRGYDTDIYFTTTGSSSLSYTTNQNSNLGSTVYNCLNAKNGYNMYAYRDKAWADGDMTLDITGYSKCTGLNYENDVDQVRVYYKAKVWREDSNHQMSNFMIRLKTSDGTVSSWHYIDVGTCSYDYWWDYYKTWTDSGVLSDIGAGKYISEIETKVYVDGNWRKRETRLYLDYFDIYYYLDQDL